MKMHKTYSSDFPISNILFVFDDDLINEESINFFSESLKIVDIAFRMIIITFTSKLAQKLEPKRLMIEL